jgi:hypothetical protein
MPLPGKGFLAIWNDAAAEHEAEWLKWHTREHMPERVGVPGFLAGRRYLDPSSAYHRYFTLYLGEDLSTFNSPPYLERLNNPTPWTRATGPYFRNFLRGACRVVASSGSGTSGALAAIRVLPDGVATTVDATRAAALTDRLAAIEGIVAAHLGMADAAVTSVPTKERAARGATTEPVFHGVLIVEGLSRHDLARLMPTISDALQAAKLGVTPSESGLYDLSWSLTKADL